MVETFLPNAGMVISEYEQGKLKERTANLEYDYTEASYATDRPP